MSREFPDFVDPWKAADGKRAFQGTMPLRWMRRLAPLLAPADPGGAGDGGGASAEVVTAGAEATNGPPPMPWPDASFRLRFGYDEQGVVAVDLKVEADLPLICQRSMQPYREHVERHSLLGVVESVADQDQLPAHYEPVLVEHGRLALVDLVEDELLLAVPQVPRNPAVAEVALSTEGEKKMPETAGEKPRQRPFSELAEMLEKAGRRN
jgi:uncharacterized protein